MSVKNAARLLAALTAAAAPAGAQDVVSDGAAAGAGPAGPIGPVRRAPFPQTTDNRRSFTNFNEEVARGLVVTPDNASVYALNVPLSKIVRFSGFAAQPNAVWPTVNQPVAIAFWNGDLLVAGGASHLLAWHHPGNGAFFDVLELDAEPCDLVVDEDRDRAFVSCQASDTVLEVDLLTFSVARRYALPAKRPGFLDLDPRDPFDPDDAVVWVTPMVSGNNTLAYPGDDGAIILDGSDPALFPLGGLPDEDLFRIDPQAPLATAVSPALRSAASLLMAHGRHPTTGEHWIVGLEEINADPTLDTEPAVKGRFARNVVAIATPVPGAPPTPTAVVDLDDADPVAPGEQYGVATSVSFPYALAFSSSGTAWIAGSTSDRLVRVDAAGTRQLQLDLPAGSAPRQVVLDPLTGGFLLVYCQNTNRVEVFQGADATPTPLVSMDLGLDPTPPAVKAGREIWYDADRTMDGRVSCNVCHPAGGSDGLGWELAGPPVDQKDVMVTQPLFGIEDTFPYHWRGERTLAQFNQAFPGLLGTAAPLDESPGGEAEQLYEFVFSLQQHANPTQHVNRVVVDALTPEVQPNGLVGSAVDGIRAFTTILSDRGKTCAECHVFPTGTNGDIIPDIDNSQIASMSSMDIAHFDNQLVLKRQAIVPVQKFDELLQRPFLGFGTNHNGRVLSLFNFVSMFPPLTDQDQADITAFITQWDHGISPAAHRARNFVNSSPPADPLWIENVLLPQARRGWIDVVAHGRYPVGGIPVRLSWTYDAGADVFRCEDSTVGPVTFADFRAETATELARNVFLGVPPGNGLRLGIDNDLDGLFNLDELAAGLDPYDPDSDADGWPDGYETLHGGDPLDDQVGPQDTTPPAVVGGGFHPDFVTATTAKITFETDEPVTWQITMQTPGGAPHTARTLDPDTVHTAVLRQLEGSAEGFKTNNFTGTALLTDLSGNTTVLPVPTFATNTVFFDGAPHHTVVGDLQWTQLAPDAPGGSIAATARVRVDYKEGGPPALPAPEQVVVAQVLVKDTVTGLWGVSGSYTTSLPTSFALAGVPYTWLPGGFLVAAPTDASGEAVLDFVVSGLAPGQEVRLNVVAVVEVTDPGTYDPGAPDFPQFQPMLQFQFPATPEALRGIETTL